MSVEALDGPQSHVPESARTELKPMELKVSVQNKRWECKQDAMIEVGVINYVTRVMH